MKEFLLAMYPDFLTIGPMKSGTTWIQNYLEFRNDVCLPANVKETFYFDHYWYRSISWYESHFKHCLYSNTTLCLEVGSSYFHNQNVPPRIKQCLGDIPLLVTLRDPVKRAWSHYIHLRRYGYTNSLLLEAVKHFPEIIEASRYKTCLQYWYNSFSPSSIHFVWQDVLAQSPNAYAQHVCRALGIVYLPPSEDLLNKTNEASIPYSHLLAALGDRSAHFMRRVGFYNIVNTAKRIGLKRLFFGKPGSASDIQPTTEEREWLEKQLEGEIPPEAQAMRPKNLGSDNYDHSPSGDF